MIQLSHPPRVAFLVVVFMAIVPISATAQCGATVNEGNPGRVLRRAV